MLGFLGLAFAWGYLKSRCHNLKRSPGAFHDLGFQEATEELLFRGLLEQWGLRSKLNVGAETSRLISSAVFGAIHAGNVLDATLGGYLYSKAMERGGLQLSILTHLAHNFGVHTGGRP